MKKRSTILALAASLLALVSVYAKREPWTGTRLEGYSRKATFTNEPAKAQDAETLWFKRPAIKWDEALPLGNGTFGAMIFGGIDKDVVQFNHIDLWLPPSVDDEFIFEPLPNKEAELAQVRQLMFEGKTCEAHQIIKDEFLVYAKDRFQGMGAYLTFGELKFDYDFAQDTETIDAYQRQLDMELGVTRTRFTVGKTTYQREAFVADGLNVVGIRMTATGPDSITTAINLSRPVSFPHQEPEYGSLGNNGIYMKGIANPAKKTPHATSYGAAARVFTTGGTVTSQDGTVQVKGAKEMVVIFSGATDFNEKDPFEPLKRDLVADAHSALKAFNAEGWQVKHDEAVAVHSGLFNRVHLRLGPERENTLPSDVRLINSSTAAEFNDSHYENYDSMLDAQIFQLGRYILIASARGKTAPPLPGLWSPELMPMWSGDYHHNVNTQMFYWPADVANLGECHKSYFEMMDRQLPSGQKLVSEMFGCRGAAATVLNGGYKVILPSMPPRAFWMMGGAWSATHIMEHFRFGLDREFLETRGYPLLREHVLFCLDWMVEDPDTGRLVLGPDASPENVFATSEEELGKKEYSHEDMGTAMDQQIAWQLFTDIIEAAEILGIEDDAVVAEAKAALPRLDTAHISADGRIREWSHDYLEGEPSHRHVSHLFAFYPGYQFHTGNAGDLVQAARNTLALRSSTERGAGKVGWSISWLMSLYARFLDIDKAEEFMLRYHSEKVVHKNLMGRGGNALEQSTGFTAGIAEMLVQSHRNEIELLPALPKLWPEGEVSGLVARGGFEVSMEWKNGALIDASVLSRFGNSCKVRYGDNFVALDLKAGQSYNLKNELKL